MVQFGLHLPRRFLPRCSNQELANVKSTGLEVISEGPEPGGLRISSAAGLLRHHATEQPAATRTYAWPPWILFFNLAAAPGLFSPSPRGSGHAEMLWVQWGESPAPSRWAAARDGETPVPPGPYALGQQVSPSHAQAPFGTPPLPKELQRVFLTPFKQDTDIHSPRPSHKHSARVGGRCEARTRLHQRDALHPGTAAPPAVGTANHHVLVKRENAVLSRQRKTQISRQRPQAIALFSFSERHFGVSKPCSLVRSGRG